MITSIDNLVLQLLSSHNHLRSPSNLGHHLDRDCHQTPLDHNHHRIDSVIEDPRTPPSTYSQTFQLAFVA